MAKKSTVGVFFEGAGIVFIALVILAIAFAMMKVTGLDIGGLFIPLIFFIVIILGICAVIVALAHFSK